MNTNPYTNPVPTLFSYKKYGRISDVGNVCVKTVVFVMMQQGNVNARQALQVSNMISSQLIMKAATCNAESTIDHVDLWMKHGS